MSLSRSNPELFENKTLGEATTSPFLDQVQEQQKEDFNARQEGREARTVVAVDRYPKFMDANTVPSDSQPKLKFSNGDPINYAAPVDETDENDDFGVGEYEDDNNN